MLRDYIDEKTRYGAATAFNIDPCATRASLEETINQKKQCESY
jgi:hypothetical protein